MNIVGLDIPSYDSLYGMVIVAGMSALAGGSGVGVTGVEYVVTFFLVSGAHELVPDALMPVVEEFLCSELAVMMLLFQNIGNLFECRKMIWAGRCCEQWQRLFEHIY